MPDAPDTIVLVHGFWVTPRSWEDWIVHYQARGFSVLAPGYPGFEVEVEALNADPAPIEALTVPAIIEHLTKLGNRLGRVLLRSELRALQGPALAEHRRQLGELGRLGTPLVHDAPREEPGRHGRGGVGAEEVDQGQGDLPLAQVAPRRLAEALGVAGDVEQVVHDLEGHAHVPAVPAPTDGTVSAFR